ncbi:VOC family protein [Arthrobacter sp. CAN_A1]|uniref:VOC family protein n=1 Tax=Arthrobacter sp. CAN_A1 TaxID=2787717 RepID=UPI0018CB709B
MLRVRPTMITTDNERMAALFRTLGLLPAEGTAGETLYDAGGGRIALRRAGDGRNRIGFEAGDLAEFARRTRESGTTAELAEPDGGTAVHAKIVQVTAPGVAFTVHQGERAARSGADPNLTVVGVWHTPEPRAAAKVLGDIGARPQPAGQDGWVDFVAKNGGLVSVRAGDHQRVDVGFEYTGELPSLRDRVLGAGFPAVLASAGALLQVPLPSGEQMIISRPRCTRR